jgi:RNA polymerase sigma factor (sigma-70 family)
MGVVEALALREKAAKQSKRRFEETLALRLSYDDPAAMKAAEREGKMARKRLVTVNIPFAASIARKLYDRIIATERAGMSRQDMVHEGVTGLVRASELFDPSKGFRFTTYAHAWVRQAIIRSVHANGRTIRIPSHAHVLKKAAYNKQLEIQNELGRSVTKEEIAESSSRLTVEMLEKFKDLSMVPLSLDANASQESDELDLASPDDAELGPSDAVAREIEMDFLRSEIRASLELLPAPQGYVLRRRFGLVGDGPSTLTEIGATLNKSGEGVRYLEKKALENLKKQDGLTIDGVTVSLAQHLDTSNDAKVSPGTPVKPKRRRAKLKSTTTKPSALDLVRSIDLA